MEFIKSVRHSNETFSSKWLWPDSLEDAIHRWPRSENVNRCVLCLIWLTFSMAFVEKSRGNSLPFTSDIWRNRSSASSWRPVTTNQRGDSHTMLRTYIYIYIYCTMCTYIHVYIIYTYKCVHIYMYIWGPWMNLKCVTLEGRDLRKCDSFWQRGVSAKCQKFRDVFYIITDVLLYISFAFIYKYYKNSWERKIMQKSVNAKHLKQRHSLLMLCRNLSLREVFNCFSFSFSLTTQSAEWWRLVPSTPVGTWHRVCPGKRSAAEEQSRRS